jgi:3'-phosphoadenosine 5'-phosphosulfate sulfotransferase (PAPS reductase)/FAD synthetase
MNAISDIRYATPVDFASYDVVLCAFSGGKDSLACVLHLLEMGVPRERIELHHHDIDGRGQSFMDWPCTPAYCRAVSDHLDIPLYFSWRQGGFLGELHKVNARTKPIAFETPEGEIGEAGGIKGNISTREKYPQTSGNLMVRWCSAILKIDVLRLLVTNQRRFDGMRLLIVTGERAQESANRAHYAEFEAHKSLSAQKRPVDSWRPVHKWLEADVWEIIGRHKIAPHPAYQLGWGRLSCRTCIFGSPNQWATIRALYPDRFEAIATREEAFGVTIKRGRTVRQQADRGTPYAAALARPELAAMADRDEWTLPIVQDPWSLPAGAYGEAVGPS